VTLRIAAEVDLQAAIDGGLLEERHTLDIKRELAPGPEANKSLAQDLAAFAIDGGQLIIGVAENPVRLHPVPLDGLGERVESVSLARVDQPLQVSTTGIPSAEDPAKGYLMVTVPASPLAPHMVDHAYYGRGDKRNYRLSDLEVARLIARRRQWQEDAVERIRELMAKDPTGPGSRTQGHMFLLASPVAPPRELLLALLSGAGWQSLLQEAAMKSAKRPLIDFHGPDPGDATGLTRRADGASLVGQEFLADGAVAEGSREDGLLEIAFGQSGEIRVFCGRGTDIPRGQDLYHNFHLVPQGDVIGWCYLVVGMAQNVAALTGFSGNWAFGLGISQLRGAQSWDRVIGGGMYAAAAYNDDSYVEAATATLIEIEAAPHAIVERMAGRLLRALDCRHLVKVEEALAPPVDLGGG
jgi:hypothetical protein